MLTIDPKSLSLTSRNPLENALAFYTRQQSEMDKLQAASDALPTGTLKGFLYQTPVADGYACYLVTSEAPLTLKHIDYLDGYALPKVFICGLTRETLLEAAAWRQRTLAAQSRPCTRALTPDY